MVNPWLLASTTAPTSSSLTSGSRRLPRMAPIKPGPIFFRSSVFSNRDLLEGLLDPGQLLAQLLPLLVLGFATRSFVQLGKGPGTHLLLAASLSAHPSAELPEHRVAGLFVRSTPCLCLHDQYHLVARHGDRRRPVQLLALPPSAGPQKTFHPSLSPIQRLPNFGLDLAADQVPIAHSVGQCDCSATIGHHTKHMFLSIRIFRVVTFEQRDMPKGVPTIGPLLPGVEPDDQMRFRDPHRSNCRHDRDGR